MSPGRHKETNSARDGIDDVVDRLLDLLLLVAATVGLFAVIAALNRWFQRGWHVQHAQHLGVYLMLIAALGAGRRIRRRTRILIILGAMWINGLGNLFWHGLAGTGMLFMAVVCIMTAMLWTMRAAIHLFIVSAAAVVAVAVGVRSGHIPIIENPEIHLRAATDWTAQGMVFLALTLAAMVSVNAIQQALRRSSDRLRSRTSELEREVEERRRIALMLSEREEKYRLLAENSRDVVFTQDMSLNITYASPSAAELFGYTEQEIKALKMSDVMTPESLELAMRFFVEAVESARTSDAQVPLMEFEYVRRDGSTFFGELHVSFLKDAEGRLTGSQGVLRDITERKQAERSRAELEEKLHQAERLQAIGQLAGGIAHDFNNQLAGVIGYAEMIKRNPKADDASREYAKKILTPACRAAELTQKLLAFARKGQYRKETIDLHGMVREVISILERGIDKSIAVHQSLEAPLHLICGDPALVQSAVLNVALNARDAMPNGGEMFFSTDNVPGPPEKTRVSNETGNGFVRLLIRDTGIGMTEDTKFKVFEPFFTTKPMGQGTGMGLAAVYGTMQSHGGTVEVKSSSNEGTTFVLSFPATTVENASVEPSDQPAVKQGNGHLLIIDDEPVVLDMTREMLEGLGYRVTAMSSAKEAISFYGTMWAEIDLVLLDMVMPDISGVEVFDSLKESNPDARILLFSGYSPRGGARELLRRGASGFLQKPFSLSELSSAVVAAIERLQSSGSRRKSSI